MKRLIIIILLGFVLSACGGGGSDGGGAASGGISDPDGPLTGPLTFVKLRNSETGNPLSDGIAKVRIITIDFAASPSDTGSCCVLSFGENKILLGSGPTDSSGTFAFIADGSKMPLEDNLINYDFSNPHPSMDTPEEVASILSTMISTLPGYYASGDGPGFFKTTVPITRDRILPTTTDKTIFISVKPM